MILCRMSTTRKYRPVSTASSGVLRHGILDHLTNEFETAAQEAAYNGWLRAEVQASRAEGGPYVENSVFLAEMKRHYNALAEAAGSR